jgi:hypothetical protein
MLPAFVRSHDELAARLVADGRFQAVNRLERDLAR